MAIDIFIDLDEWTFLFSPQIVYMVLVGSFPFNSFLSGLFCHLGLFALGGK